MGDYRPDQGEVKGNLGREGHAAQAPALRVRGSTLKISHDNTCRVHDSLGAEYKVKDRLGVRWG